MKETFKRTIIKAIISVVVGMLIGVWYATNVDQEFSTFTHMIMWAGVVFGYVFGWNFFKKVLAFFGHTAADASMFALIASAMGAAVSMGPALFLLLLLFLIALVLGWIPGVLFGIYQIIAQAVLLFIEDSKEKNGKI